MTYDNEAAGVGTSSVSAMFDSEAEASRAVDRLGAAGIPPAQIRQVAGNAQATTRPAGQENDKGFWESLGDFFFPDEDRYTYAEGLSRGGYLVTVTDLSGTQYDTALDILDDEGSINLDERAENWRSEGWGGYESSPYASRSPASSYGRPGEMTAALKSPYIDNDTLARSGSTTGDHALNQDEAIPVIEERLRVGKRATGHGRVRVRAYTVEEPVHESVELREERVEIERRPVDREVTSADGAFQDRTLEAEEYREEAVIQKEARVVEEIGLRKTSESHREDITDTVRRTEVEIDKNTDHDSLAGGTRRIDPDPT